jgi:hypothetical protein
MPIYRYAGSVQAHVAVILADAALYTPLPDLVDQVL